MSRRRRQCAKCPWRVDVDPNAIPNGYSLERHRALEQTIAVESRLDMRQPQMACHESRVGSEFVCVGWLANQLGPGNNVALRLRVALGQVSADYELVGEQHACFADTLPKPARGRHEPSRRRR